MAKHFLNTGNDELDFVLIGLSSAEDQYRMLSLVNETLGTEFFLSDYLPLNLKDGKIFRFSLYRFMDDELRLEYFFIPNASNFDEPQTSQAGGAGLFSGMDLDESVRLVKELPKTDYFLILKGEDLHHFQFKIMERLKEIPQIVQLQAIEVQDLPSRRNLIF